MHLMGIMGCYGYTPEALLLRLHLEKHQFVIASEWTECFDKVCCDDAEP